MARMSVEELYRGERDGSKYGSGGIMGAVTKHYFEKQLEQITVIQAQEKAKRKLELYNRRQKNESAIYEKTPRPKV